MANYWTCPFCNSNLDFGEVCECAEKKDAPPKSVRPQENYHALSISSKPHSVKK